MFSWQAATSGKTDGQQIIGNACVGSGAELSCRLENEAKPGRDWHPTASGFQRWVKPARLVQERVHGFSIQEMKNVAERKLCCSARAMFNPLSVAAACNSKFKTAAKRLRSGQSPGFVDPAP